MSAAANDSDWASLGQFLAELTALSDRYGLGIEGGTLYLLVAEDRLYRYDVDGSSALVRT